MEVNFLLDAHTFLWAITDDKRLSTTAREVFTRASNELLLSSASVWEILIKVQIGKLQVPLPTGNYLKRHLTANNIQVLPIRLEHVLRLEQLPLHHRDPFDRILVAQSLEEKMPIVSCDLLFKKYPVKVVW